MVGHLTKTVYKYEAVELKSGATVTAYEVTVQDKKVMNIPTGQITVKVDEQPMTFSFGIYNYGVNGEVTYNLHNMPASIDGQGIVKEFVAFVEKDIA